MKPIHSTKFHFPADLCPYKIQDKIRHYDFEACINWLNEVGKKYLDKNFIIFRQDFPVIHEILVYLIQDKDASREYNLSLSKGLLLTGNIGTGKTSLMKLLSVFPGTKPFLFASSRSIVHAFRQEGYEILEQYTRFSQNICFDDLGLEENHKYYGNETNVMAEILLDRYEKFKNLGILTMATTNLNATELEEIYGNRVRSRLREMFNQISLVGSDKRT